MASLTARQATPLLAGPSGRHADHTPGPCCGASYCASASPYGIRRQARQQWRWQQQQPRAYRERQDSAGPPPPPPPPPDFAPVDGASQADDMTFAEIKERYIRPVYLPGSFALGFLTLGLRTAASNFVLSEDPFSYLACSTVTGLMCMAFAWVLFDFTDDPPSGGNFSSPQ